MENPQQKSEKKTRAKPKPKNTQPQKKEQEFLNPSLVLTFD